MLENFIKVSDITATRDNLPCLMPNQPISVLVSSDKQVLNYEVIYTTSS